MCIRYIIIHIVRATQALAHDVRKPFSMIKLVLDSLRRAKNFSEVSGDARKEVEQFLGDIDEDDDVHRVYVAMK